MSILTVSHYQELCKKCQRVLGQCRCMAADKPIYWGICPDCANPKPEPIKPFQVSKPPKYAATRTPTGEVE